jgi:hypothetical protein
MNYTSHNYTIHGPFEICKKKNGLVDRSQRAQKEFWDQVQKEVKLADASLPSACGCYLFAIRAGKGLKPWYVGIAQKQAFRDECFAIQKINAYNDAIADRRGKPLLFLIAKRTPKGKMAKPGRNGHRDASFLEDVLIATARKRNPKLMNVKKTKFLKEMCVPCIMNTPRGHPTQSEKEFERALYKRYDGDINHV